MESVDLKLFAGGALQEKFDRAFHEVLQNMQDPNTPYKVKRGITITIGFTQTEFRDSSTATVEVKTKLAPASPIETHFALGKDLETGQVYAEEYGKQVRGQMTIEDMKNVSEQIHSFSGSNNMQHETPNEVVDPETGEILEEEEASTSSNVVDLRAAR